MNHNERQLMRLLHGELTPKEATMLEADIERDDALRTTYVQLAAAWQHLELPTPQPVPSDFASRLEAATRQRLDQELNWIQAPTWARMGAAVALTAGMMLGLALGSETLAPEKLVTLEEIAELEDTAALEGSVQADFELDSLSLAEIYWLSIDDQERLFSEISPDDDAGDVTGGPVR